MKKRLGIATAEKTDPPKKSRSGNEVQSYVEDLYNNQKINAQDVIDGVRADTASSSSGAGSVISRLGEGTRPKQNQSRDVKRALSHGVTLPLPYVTEASLGDRKARKKISRPLGFLPIQDIVYTTVDPDCTAEYCSFTPEAAKLDVELGDTIRRVSATRKPTDSGIAIWGDCARYHTRDSVHLLTFYFLSGIHHLRHWLVAFSKRDTCQCGCRGKCTYDVVFDVIGWMLKWCALGRMPNTNHLGQKFSELKGEANRQRAKLAGRLLPIRIFY